MPVDEQESYRQMFSSSNSTSVVGPVRRSSMSSDGSMWNEVNEKYVGVNDPDMMNVNNWMKG